MTNSGKTKIYYGYVVIAAAFVILTITWGANRTFGVFLKPMLTEFGWSRASISGAFTLTMIVMGMAGFLTGRLTDRFGPRIVVLLCGLCLGAGYLLASLIQSVWQFYIVYGVMTGVGMSLSPSLLSLASRWFVKRRALMASIITAGPAVGNMVMPILFSMAVYDFGWRYSFVTMAGLVIVFVLSVVMFLRRDPGEMGLLPYGTEKSSEEAAPMQNEGLSVLEAFRTRQYWLLSVVLFSDLFLMNVITVHIVIYAMDLGIPATQAAGILSVASGVCIFARILIGGIADKMGYKPTFAACLSLAVVAFALLLVADSLWMFYLFAAIFGIGLWASGGLTTIMTAELFGLKSHGGIYGSVFFSGSIGGAFGPVVVGRLYDMNGGYDLAFIICLFISVLALIALLALKPIDSKNGV